VTTAKKLHKLFHGLDVDQRDDAQEAIDMIEKLMADNEAMEQFMQFFGSCHDCGRPKAEKFTTRLNELRSILTCMFNYIYISISVKQF
jgi:hypothetical protein